MEEKKLAYRQVIPVAAVSWSGALLEWLDFYTYAILAKVLASIYFPSHDPIASLLAAFAALAIGFLFRPLGALMFGKIGDQFGRKIAFLTAITMMMIGTLGIAVLPSYASIGILASIGIFLLRIIQGLALGGGYGAAITYLGEFTPDKIRGLVTGFLFTTPAFGMAIAGNLASIFQGYFGIEAFKEYGWRWCFVVAGLVVFVVALIIHIFYKETPIFTTLKQIRRVTSAPIKELFTNKHYLYLFLLAWIGVIGAHGPVWYTNQLYVSYFMQDQGMPAGDAGKILAYATYAVLWTYLFFGWISDKIGRKPVLVFGIYANALIFPLIFYLMKGYFNPPDFTALLLLTMILTFMNGIGYSGAMSAMLLELFPSRIRTTAVGFTYNMGYGVFGGLTPFMITAFFKITGDQYISIILWSTCLPILMGLFYIIKGWETKGKRLWEELSAEKFAEPAVIVSPDTTIGEAMKKMKIEGVRVAIVAHEEKYMGILEERQLIGAIVAGHTLNTPVEKVVIPVEAVDKNARIIDAVSIINEKGFKGIAVVDENGRPVGVVEPRHVFNEVTIINASMKKPFTERIKVEEFMNKAVTVEETAKLKDIAKILVQTNIGFLPVISKNTGKIVGVISEKDLMGDLCCVPENLEKSVKEFMISDVVTVNPESSLKEALENFAKNNIRHIPVVKEEKVIGVISVKDALRLL